MTTHDHHIPAHVISAGRMRQIQRAVLIDLLDLHNVTDAEQRMRFMLMLDLGDTVAQIVERVCRDYPHPLQSSIVDTRIWASCVRHQIPYLVEADDCPDCADEACISEVNQTTKAVDVWLMWAAALALATVGLAVGGL